MPRKNLIQWTPRGRLKKFIEKRSNETYITCAGLEFHCKDRSQIDEVNSILSNLDRERVTGLISPDQYKEKISDLLYLTTGIEMNWKNPRTFQEKICWMKLYDVTPLKTRCADKLLVRGYISEKIGGEYLIPLLGVWENPDDIDFDALPDQFVMKVNHGWNMNLIVKDKSTIDTRFAREKLKAWMMNDLGMRSFEFQYSKIPRRIMAEKFIRSIGESDTPDFKFHCFHGEPKFIQFMIGRYIDLHHTFFDLSWNPVPYFTIDYPCHKHPEKIPRPKNLELMTDLAHALSKDFPFTRVDFYEIDGKIFIGELTFSPAGGLINYNSPEYNEKLGDLIQLPKKSKPFNPF